MRKPSFQSCVANLHFAGDTSQNVQGVNKGAAEKVIEVAFYLIRQSPVLDMGRDFWSF